MVSSSQFKKKPTNNIILTVENILHAAFDDLDKLRERGMSFFVYNSSMTHGLLTRETVFKTQLRDCSQSLHRTGILTAVSLWYWLIFLIATDTTADLFVNLR